MVGRIHHMKEQQSVPKMTVAISLFNYSNYIERAIESVCKQTIANIIELIIVDDASTDNSVEIVRKFEANNTSLIRRLASIKLKIHKKNRGLAAARNTAFELAETSDILILDADNYLLPQACSCLLETLMASDNDIGAVYPLLAVKGNSNQKIANELPWNASRFRIGNYVDAMALVRKKAWECVGGYQHTPGGWEDYDFWCRFVEHDIKAKQVPKLLGIYHHHQDSMKNTDTIQRQSELCKLLQQRHPWLQLISHQST